MTINVTFSNGDDTITDRYIMASLGQVAGLADSKVASLNSDLEYRKRFLSFADETSLNRIWVVSSFVGMEDGMDADTQREIYRNKLAV